MIKLNVNGIEMVGRLPHHMQSIYKKNGFSTDCKRQILSNAFQQMPDHLVEKLWDSCVDGERHLTILNKKTE